MPLISAPSRAKRHRGEREGGGRKEEGGGGEESERGTKKAFVAAANRHSRHYVIHKQALSCSSLLVYPSLASTGGLPARPPCYGVFSFPTTCKPRGNVLHVGPGWSLGSRSVFPLSVSPSRSLYFFTSLSMSLRTSTCRYVLSCVL